MKQWVIALAVGMMATKAWACAEQDLTIKDAWAGASLGNAKAGSAYVTLANRGSHTLVLTGAESPLADRVEIHTHVMEGDVMAMRHVEALEIAPGKTEIFQPGGLHLMLFGLKAPIEAGQDVPLTLQFEDGTTREIIAKAKPLAEWKSQKAPMHDAHH